MSTLHDEVRISIDSAVEADACPSAGELVLQELQRANIHVCSDCKEDVATLVLSELRRSAMDRR